MHIHFTPRGGGSPGSALVDALLAFLLARPHYGEVPGGARYENPDTGAAFELGRVSAERGRLPVLLHYPARMARVFAAELADELAVITSAFGLLISWSPDVQPFSRSGFVQAFERSLRWWLESDMNDGRPWPWRMPKHRLVRAYDYNAGIGALRAWAQAITPDAVIRRVYCVVDQTGPRRLATAVDWDPRLALLPEVDLLVIQSEAGRVAVPFPRGLGTPRSRRERLAGVEVGLEHFLLNDGRAHVDASLLGATGAPVRAMPWSMVVDADDTADVAVPAGLERMTRRLLEPSFALSWHEAELRGDGTLTEDAQVIGQATPAGLADVARALLDAHRRGDLGATSDRAPICTVAALEHELRFVDEASLAKVVECVHATFAESRGRSPGTSSPDPARSYRSSVEAVNDFLAWRGQGWRVPPRAGSGCARSWAPDLRASFAGVIPPPGYQPTVIHDCTHQVDVDFGLRELTVLEAECKGADLTTPVREPIDDEWLECFRRLAWP